MPSAVRSQYQTRTWLDWRTIESGRFAVHFPAELQDWAASVAGRMSGIDSAVSGAARYQPPRKIDIVIDDPFRIPNGSAWPLLDNPTIVLWASPPSPREDIGTYVTWADMLATHEFAHLAHLLRPSRNRLQQLLWHLAPVELGPISRKAPRWLIEGYATYMEGRITKSGRPNGVWRSAILRQWAIEGALPTYGQLDRMGGMYGGEFPYLAGSAFIDWLIERRSERAIIDLWQRMSARRDRGFVEAFTGVYGEPPDVLYGRFVAQLTAESIANQAARAADSGTVIQHLARETGDPALSADGGRAAIMLASATRPGRIVIWKAIPEPDTTSRRAADALLERDPQDVPPVRVFPPPKRALATLHPVGNQSYQDPRFFRDGRVLVWRNKPLGNGAWSPDLYIWDPQRRTVKRLTKHANVKQGDPSPDGATVAATQCAAAKCDLVLVDARTGVVSTLARGNDTLSFHRPRFSRDGSKVLVGVRVGGFWRVGLVPVAGGAMRLVSGAYMHTFDASFVDDSTLVAASNQSGSLNIALMRLDGRVIRTITGVTGAAVAPEPNPADGSVWFLSMHARGWDVRSVRPEAGTPPRRVEPEGIPVVPSPPPIALPVHSVSAPARYAPERKWLYFPGGASTREGTSVMLGVANTDPVGRHELLLQLAKSTTTGPGSASWQGGSATVTNRSRIPLTASGFWVAQEGDRWRGLRGLSISAEAARRFETRSGRLMTGFTVSQASTDYSGFSERFVPRTLAFGELSGAVNHYYGGRRTTFGAAASGVIGHHGESDVARQVVSASITSNQIPISATGMLGFASTNHFAEQFTIGGHPATLLPAGVLSQQVAMPALPSVFVGKRVETYRLAVPLGPVQLFTWGGRAWTGRRPRLERVHGVEWTAHIAQVSALGTPAARVTAGIGQWENRRDLGPYYGPLGYFIPGRNAIQGYFITQFGDWAR